MSAASPAQPAPSTLSTVTSLVATAVLLLSAHGASAQTPPLKPSGPAAPAAAASSPVVTPYGAQLEGFVYPHPVQRFRFTSQQQALEMAYMDIAPTGKANGRTAVLLHGKNFCGATWDATITALSAAGFRVIAPDQIGFCASTKPASYQFSFAQLAANTQALLASLHIQQATMIGHSMGGMLAMRYALQYPQAVEQLVVVNPLGLEDWQAKGVPYASIDDLYRGELKTSYDSIKAYQMKFYFNGHWKPQYDKWVLMQAGLYSGHGKALVAWNQAQTSDMVYSQPVVHELSQIRVKTLLMIGGKDRTAPGANRASPALQAQLGHYAALGRLAAKAIPNATLVEFPDMGHGPQVESPAEFHDALLRGLNAH
ncbi:alpha/beta fold hydrolase [Roseateles amylovorans]|uniref:Alpha/beta hydrolase n=1 Tax=Roseateles amylovorans TaxID=2978473 RepID=A0ABY6AY44_9BURK|nr:alpha/beta hydrolase [Roseateles amylovorans]UXH77218.1 alpha/beta hydrolase [Roseateles amylovorans]